MRFIPAPASAPEPVPLGLAGHAARRVGPGLQPPGRHPGTAIGAHAVDSLLDAMQPGEVLQLISNCPGAPADINAWVKTKSLELAAMHESARGEYHFYIRKK